MACNAAEDAGKVALSFHWTFSCSENMSCAVESSGTKARFLALLGRGLQGTWEAGRHFQ